MPLPEPVIDGALLERIATGLRQLGWVVIDHALPDPVVEVLRHQLTALDWADFAPAGVGRDAAFTRTEAVRRDRIHWLDPEGSAGRWYFDWVESLRLGLNRSLFLGLFDYECHLAWYPPGAFYTAHVDAFRGAGNRKVSTVLYLNGQWQPADGGELVLYDSIGTGVDFDPDAPRALSRIVAPTTGTLVCFLSEEIPHEVLPATADRYSIAGWFRVNAHGDRVDPPLLGPRREPVVGE